MAYVKFKSHVNVALTLRGGSLLDHLGKACRTDYTWWPLINSRYIKIGPWVIVLARAGDVTRKSIEHSPHTPDDGL